MAANPRSVVLVDWARDNEPTASSRSALLYELMLHCLLQDEVLVQDEIFVCSKNLARWFHEPKTFRLLEELFEAGGLVVLKRPLKRYPSDDLQEMAQKQPVFARRAHLEQFSVGNNGKPLRFKDKRQLNFHSRLQACLEANSGAHRDAGVRSVLGGDLMCAFGEGLSQVLTDVRYEKWLGTKFAAISPAMAYDFVGFVENPNAASERVAASGQRPKFTPDQGRPVFNTALAVQVAGTYLHPQATAMQELIETVFAVPFCEDEDAAGKYGAGLRELPLPPEDDLVGVKLKDLVRVEARVLPQKLRLPIPERGFGEILRKVREGSGKELRRAMAEVGSEITFRKQEEAWRAVAEEMASLIADDRRSCEVRIGSIAASIGKEIVFGTIAEFPQLIWRAAHAAAASPKHLFWLPVQLTGAAAISVAGGYLYELRRVDLERQEISDQLDKAVEFRCVKIPTLPKVRRKIVAGDVTNS